MQHSLFLPLGNDERKTTKIPICPYQFRTFLFYRIPERIARIKALYRYFVKQYFYNLFVSFFFFFTQEKGKKGQNKGKSIDTYSQKKKNILKNSKKVLDKLSQM